MDVFTGQFGRTSRQVRVWGAGPLAPGGPGLVTNALQALLSQRPLLTLPLRSPAMLCLHPAFRSFAKEPKFFGSDPTLPPTLPPTLCYTRPWDSGRVPGLEIGRKGQVLLESYLVQIQV